MTKKKLTSHDDITLGVMVHKTQDDDGFLVEPDVADFHLCPECESPNITYGEPEPESFIIYRTHACDECFTTWEERYDMVRVRIEPISEKRITKVQDG